MTAAVRPAAVAGRFYPRRPDELLREIQTYTSTPDLERIPAIGCIAPHAGYMYSGRVAGSVYAHLQIPQTCIVLCPNHTGMGHPLAIMTDTFWQTPLGEMEPDSDLGRTLLSVFPLLQEDRAAHRAEHAVEVQLPFLQHLRADARFVPIAIGTRDFNVLNALGIAMAQVITAQNEKILIIASSDMNHYEPDDITRVKDRKAIDQILALNPHGLWDVVMREEISMCGFGPAVIMLTAAKKLGATSASLIEYATSGDVTGERDAVVGYAGIVVS
jgi:hypothetical protein